MIAKQKHFRHKQLFIPAVISLFFSMLTLLIYLARDEEKEKKIVWQFIFRLSRNF